MKPIDAFNAENLYVRVYSGRQAMGQAAASEMAQTLRRVLSQKDMASVMFAAAPSQETFFAALLQEKGIDWQRVVAFHMDEYLGLPKHHEAGFVNFLQKRLFGKLPLAKVHLIDGQAADPQAEAERYADLLASHPLDIVCLGVGENGHIAFNDPPVADFQDPCRVKIVTLEEACRRQQVHDGCFASLGEVPKQAITVTIPALMQARHLFGIVPGETKADAVAATIAKDPTPECPATILKTHDDARLYLDQEAARRLQE